jgi:two-component system CheB/CheR fusion protein
MINEAIGQARNLAQGVQPVTPEPNGLMAALEKLAAQTRNRFRIRCGFRCHPPVLLADNRLANHLFRIAQEAVTNAIKHGRAKSIQIGIRQKSGRIELTVNDNGVGLPARRRKTAGMGLDIMRYRTGIISGVLDIQPGAAGGTRVRCSVPHLK